jgi:hypothetical protein
MRTSKAGRRLAHRARPDRKQFELLPIDEIAFGLAEHFMRIDAKGCAHPAEQFAAERLAAGKDAAQLTPGFSRRPAASASARFGCRNVLRMESSGHHRHRRLRLEFARAVADQRNAVVPERETGR